jgi:secreted trypsin-like serine protease
MKYRFVLAGIAAPAAIAAAVPGDVPGDARIIGGVPAVLGEFPSYASLEQGFDGQNFYVCGATLLNANTAVTAAHCVRRIGSGVQIRLGSVVR